MDNLAFYKATCYPALLINFFDQSLLQIIPSIYHLCLEKEKSRKSNNWIITKKVISCFFLHSCFFMERWAICLERGISPSKECTFPTNWGTESEAAFIQVVQFQCVREQPWKPLLGQRRQYLGSSPISRISINGLNGILAVYY